MLPCSFGWESGWLLLLSPVQPRVSSRTQLPLTQRSANAVTQQEHLCRNRQKKEAVDIS